MDLINLQDVGQGGRVGGGREEEELEEWMGRALVKS